MGIVSQRRKRERARRMRRRLLIAVAVAALGALGASQDLKQTATDVVSRIAAVQVFAGEKSGQAELTLEGREIYALQLGVFDDMERAGSDQKRLEALGVRCMIWQKERMRLICAVAQSRDALNMSCAKGQETYVYKESLPQVHLRIEAGEGKLEDVQRLLSLPDSVLTALLSPQGDALESILRDTRAAAQAAQGAHPENGLYTDLAKGLLAWCDLAEQSLAGTDAQTAGSYAAVTMCALCRELRHTLMAL